MTTTGPRVVCAACGSPVGQRARVSVFCVECERRFAAFRGCGVPARYNDLIRRWWLLPESERARIARRFPHWIPA